MQFIANHKRAVIIAASAVATAAAGYVGYKAYKKYRATCSEKPVEVKATPAKAGRPRKTVSKK